MQRLTLFACCDWCVPLQMAIIGQFVQEKLTGQGPIEQLLAGHISPVSVAHATGVDERVDADCSDSLSPSVFDCYA